MRGGEQEIEVGGHMLEVAHHLVAHQEGALGGLHQPVNVLEALRPRHAEPCEQGEDDKGGQPLGGRRGVEDPRACHLHRQRGALDSLIGAEILAPQRAAAPLQIRRQLAGNVAAIEIGKARPAQMIEGIGQARLALEGAHLGRRAIHQEDVGEARNVLQLRHLLDSETVLGAGDGHARARMVHGLLQKAGQAHAPAMGLGPVEGQLPATHRARHGERRQRPAGRDGRLAARITIGGDGGALGGEAAGLDVAHLAGGRAHQPEAVAAQMVHVGIDRRDGGRRGDGRLHRIAALSQHLPPRFHRQMMGRGHHARAGVNALDGVGRAGHEDLRCSHVRQDVAGFAGERERASGPPRKGERPGTHAGPFSGASELTPGPRTAG